MEISEMAFTPGEGETIVVYTDNSVYSTDFNQLRFSALGVLILNDAGEQRARICPWNEIRSVTFENNETAIATFNYLLRGMKGIV